MVADLEDLRDDDTLEPVPRTLDPFDLRALRREELGEVIRGEVDRAALEQPGADDPHATPWNCSRKRTSPSTNSRMSDTPYWIMATRSIPRPNANPVYRSLSYPQFSSTF